MRVALEKVEGIEKVNVTLKRGVAHIVLAPGNVVSLAHLRRVVKDAGYPTRDAVVTAAGTLERSAEGLLLVVSGTKEAFLLVPVTDGSLPPELSPITGRERSRVEITGTVPAPSGTTGRDRLQVRSVSGPQ